MTKVLSENYEVLSVDETLCRMREKLAKVVPDVELPLKAELAHKINQLKIERNAVVLGHNYMEPALFHFVTDFTGDSLELSRSSTETDADIIVFCGVQFMAETAKVLSPDKMVLLPSDKAGCSLAAGMTVEDLRQLKRDYPGVPVVTYVNTYAEVKAESDYCCTSGTGKAVAQYLFDQGHDHILFLPDEYLGRNTANELGVNFALPGFLRGQRTEIGPERTLIGWRARCEVHELFNVEDIRAVRKQYPEVVIVAHPECSPEVIAESDVTGSTKQMIQAVQEMDAPKFLLLTECSMGDNIVAENPDKDMLRLCSFRCPHMSTITMEDTLEALEKLQYQIELPADIIERARIPIDR
ncbi:MAG: quinolinate synthase NadA, partial [Candidatus Hydrogenedentes bacterium]|nr:quinolinate synthase NadA [Candidatus Hydrogenedentota bacterium]